MNLTKILLVPDCHVPYEDTKAFGLMLKVARGISVQQVVLLGDFADFYSVSAHDKDPKRVQTLDDEVAAVRKRLAQLAALKPERFLYVSGNHEDRLSRYLMQKAPALVGTVDIQVLFDLERFGIEWVPYKRSARVGKLHITHDTGTAGVNAHRTSARAFLGSTIIGHTHRMSYEAVGTFDGPPYLAAMLGWLGDFKAIDYMHAVKAREWVHGFGVGYMEPSDVVHVQPVPIVNGRCVVEGRLFSV